jgi:hypothetical protein
MQAHSISIKPLDKVIDALNLCLVSNGTQFLTTSFNLLVYFNA